MEGYFADFADFGRGWDGWDGFWGVTRGYVAREEINSRGFNSLDFKKGVPSVPRRKLRGFCGIFWRLFQGAVKKLGQTETGTVQASNEA